jgi:nucleoside-diphosphate-sugar epimerase
MTEFSVQDKRVLVTGANGFLGSKLVKELLERDAEVIAMIDDDIPTWRLEPVLASKRLHLLHCSLLNHSALADHMKRFADIDLVAHLWLHVPRSTAFCEQALQDTATNLSATLNLLKVMPNSVSGICFASSVAVYGRHISLQVKEDMLPRPVTSYGATKLTIEYYLTAYGEASQIPVTTLRFTTIYGPGELRHRAIPNFMRRLAEGLPPIIWGNGSEMRDYVYIGDAIEAIIRALSKRPARVLNIGSGRSYSSLELANELIRLWPATVEPEFLPGTGKKLDIICDISAARKALGYSPETSLVEGLMKEVEWYQSEGQNLAAGKRSLKI